MLYHKPRHCVIADSVRELLPIYKSDSVGTKTITLTDYVLDKRFYAEITNIYGIYLLHYNYGIHRYLSELFIYIHGMHLRTRYYFFKSLFHLKYLALCYQAINKVACEFHYSSLKKKFIQNTYWSVSYLHKFPCRGQRRRCNASTPKKLNISYKFASLEMHTNFKTIDRKKGKVR